MEESSQASLLGEEQKLAVTHEFAEGIFIVLRSRMRLVAMTAAEGLGFFSDIPQRNPER